MLTQQELGLRLKNAREAVGFTQQQVADHIELTRVAVSQIESGQRAVNSLELMRLSRLYARDIASFLEEIPIEKDALSVLFRAHPDLIENGTLNNPLREATDLFRDYINLRDLLELDEELAIPPVYAYGEPSSVWEAIQMGERAAEEERGRLELGIDPIKDIAELIESQGIPIIEIHLDDQISGIFMADSDSRLCIFVNQSELHRAKARVSFTIAHEYAHTLLDRNKLSGISKVSNERDLFEVRANAFAAAFLMPEEGVGQYLKKIGKGEPSREKLLAYTQQADLIGHHRRLASSQVITLYDVVKLHTYFGISFDATLYRLRNLHFLTEEAFNQFYQQREEAKMIAQHLKIAEEEREQIISNFALNFTGMAIEAYRRNKITYKKLVTLADSVGVNTESVNQVISYMGLEENVEENVYLPE